MTPTNTQMLSDYYSRLSEIDHQTTIAFAIIIIVCIILIAIKLALKYYELKLKKMNQLNSYDIEELRQRSETNRQRARLRETHKDDIVNTWMRHE